MSEKETLNLLTELEQFETTMEGVAQVVASYYTALIENGVNEIFAKELALIFQNTWLASLMSPRGKK